jgi:large subunit ribosomal protein L9
MNVILTENVKGLGNMGDVVKVRPGYARNFLVPNKLAVEASDRNLKELEHHRRQLTRKAEKLSQEAAAVKARIEAVECVLTHRAGEEGKLFGSVTSMEIEAALAAKGSRSIAARSTSLTRSNPSAATRSKSSSTPA